MSATRLDARSGAGSWLLTGAVMGIIAGIIFAIFEMIVAAIMGPSFVAPLMMIGAIVLGEGALPPQPTIGLAMVISVGVIVHMVNSAIFGAIFGAIASGIGALRSSRWALILAASAFGFLLWPINFYVIGTILFPWFLQANQLWQGFVAHTFFFGSVLGLLLAARAGDEE
jgi:hypothetical protein